MRIERKVEVHLGGSSVTVGELIDVLEEFDRTTVMRIDYHKGDSRDPREYDTVTLRFTPPAKGL